MKKEFKDKKLLILGGNPETKPIVEVANNMGIKTIVASNRANDPAKEIAWKVSNIDGMNVPELVKFAKEEKVDGVLVGVADSLVPAYCEVCKELNLPCYATKEITDVLSYKDTFKRTCEKFGLHGIPEYHLTAELKQEDLDKIVYPVMIKPVDSSGGTGITTAYNEEELRVGVKKALDNSHSKRFSVERFMTCNSCSVYFTFKDGYCSLSSMQGGYASKELKGKSGVCLGNLYPSKHINLYYEKVHDKLVAMFKSIGVKNGVLSIAAFIENDEFYLFDPGFRLQGEGQHYVIKHINGYDQREMLIRFALTGSEGDIDLKKVDDPYLKGKYASSIWILLKEGKINKIDGLREIEKDSRCFLNAQRLFEGDIVQHDWIGTEKQVLTRLYFVCDTKEELANCLKEYQIKIKVYDDKGVGMTLDGFDVDKGIVEQL